MKLSCVAWLGLALFMGCGDDDVVAGLDAAGIDAAAARDGGAVALDAGGALDSGGSDAAPPPVDAGTPTSHEPAGLVRFAEEDFGAVPPAGPPGSCAGAGILDGCWFEYGSGGNITAVSEPSAPESAPLVLQFQFPTGLTPGNGVGMVQGWDTGSETDSTQYQTVYESGWVRIVGPDFEMQAVGVKLLGYMGVGQAGGPGVPNQLYFIAYNDSGSTTPVSAMKISLSEQGVQDRRLDPNIVSDPVFTCGVWHNYEMVLRLNDIGAANGTFQMWWNGVLISDYSDVVYRTATDPTGFYGRRWDPVWGGRGGPDRSRDDFMQVDHLYLSGLLL